MTPLVDLEVPWLAERARRDPDAEAIVGGGERLSFAVLASRSERLAGALAARGVRRGDRVACRLEPSVRMVELFHAIGWLGATAVLVSPRLTPGESTALLERASPALAIDEAALAELASGSAGVVAPEAPRAGDLAAILFTSGTTAMPKGVMIGADALFASACASRARLGIAAGDRWLGTLPLHHVGGLSILVRSVLDGGAVELQARFDAEAADRAIRVDGVSLLSLVPTTLMRLLEVDAAPFPATLRAVLLGGGPIPPALVERALARGVPVFPTYGLTETASQVATATPHQARRKPGSVGRTLEGTEIRLAAVDAEGRGEILVRGPTLMQGYWRDPAATARALRDGWLATGDVGRLDADGDLWIEDRRSDLVVSGGENVSPAEVEAVLLEHPAVRDVGVYAEPDPIWGQRVAAAIVPRGGTALTLAEVRRHCAARLAAFKLPRALRLVDALPRTPSGKLQRHRLREAAATEIAVVGTS